MDARGVNVGEDEDDATSSSPYPYVRVLTKELGRKEGRKGMSYRPLTEESSGTLFVYSCISYA